MKTILCIGIILLAATLSPAQTTNLTTLLQQGLFEEQASRNLDAAIADYQTLAAQFDKDRQLAATAVFRLGECYRAQGRTNEAGAQYQRILSDFSDQSTLVTLSRQDLAGMGMAKTETVKTDMPAVVENADAQLLKKLEGRSQGELEKILPTLVPDATLDELLQKRNGAQASRATLAVDYATNNVNVTRVDATLDILNKQVEDRITGIMQGLKMRAELSPTPAANKSELPGLTSPASSEEDQEIARIQQMIQNSPDLINAPAEGGSTPLCQAAYKGWLKVAAYLIDHGADVNMNTPLNTAAWAGNRAMVELLLRRGADVNSKDSQKQTPLFMAVEKKYPAVIEVLLTNKADVNAQDQYGDTPLNDPASHGLVKIVQLLLAAGANPNLENKNRRTALSLAAGSPEIVKLFLAAKADPNGGTLGSPLLSAITKNDLVSAELLLQAGANPNAKAAEVKQSGSYPPVTPLFLAISKGQLPMVQLLLKFKADPDDSQTGGQPLLFSALSNTNILETLLAAGAKVDAPNSSELVLNNTTPRNQTALHDAVYRNPDAVEVLLRHGANPNARDALGLTPLHSALWNSDPSTSRKVFELLLAYKTDPNVRNRDGQTPLDMLKQLGTPRAGQPNSGEETKLASELADLLRQHGALDNLPNWDRITVSRPGANFSAAVFLKGTNDWNHFTVLELFYRAVADHSQDIPFPDLTRVVVARPGSNGAAASRMEINLLNATNGMAFEKDMPLEFGDVVELAERGHTLAEPDSRLNDQYQSLSSYLRAQAGQVRLAVAGSQTVTVPLTDFAVEQAYIGAVLKSPVAENALTSSSDLAHVKVTRHDSKTKKTNEWILDCSRISLNNTGSLGISRGGTVSYNSISYFNAPDLLDLLLRDGDVIEVPQKQE